MKLLPLALAVVQVLAALLVAAAVPGVGDRVAPALGALAVQTPPPVPAAGTSPAPPAPLTMGRLALLARSPTPELIASLRTALASTDSGLRFVAARLIGVLRAQDLGPAAAVVLATEPDPRVAAELVRALWFIRSPESVAAIETHLRTAGPLSIVTFADGLARTDPATFLERLPELVTMLTDEHRQRIGWVVRRTAGERPELRSRLAPFQANLDPPRAGQGLAVNRPEGRAGMRTFPALWSGFMTSLLAETGCEVSDQIRLGGATVTYRPDGRPAQAAIEGAALPERCRAVIEALVRVTIAEERVPLVPTTQDAVVLPLHQAVVACMDEPSDPLSGDAHRIGQSAASAPVKTVDVKPVYPASARASGTSGLVILEGTISNRGCIRDIAVIRSPSAPLSISAIQAVSQWGYAPGLIAGAPVEVRMTVTVNFSLR